MIGLLDRYAALAITCPRKDCGAHEGFPCWTSGVDFDSVHDERIQRFQRVVREGLDQYEEKGVKP